MRVAFVIPYEPMGKERPRAYSCHGHTQVYTPYKTREYEEMIKTIYSLQVGHKWFPDDAEILLEVIACFAVPKSASKTKRELMLNGDILPRKKPDYDNIAKIITDALNGVAYKDDSQIVWADIRKKYAKNPCVYVTLTSINHSEPSRRLAELFSNEKGETICQD